MDELIDICVKNMVSDDFTEEQARAYMKEMLPKLDYWKRYDELSDNGEFEEFKKQLIKEINELHIDGLPKVEKLNALVGKWRKSGIYQKITFLQQLFHAHLTSVKSIRCGNIGFCGKMRSAISNIPACSGT